MPSLHTSLIYSDLGRGILFLDFVENGDLERVSTRDGDRAGTLLRIREFLLKGDDTNEPRIAKRLSEFIEATKVNQKYMEQRPSRMARTSNCRKLEVGADISADASRAQGLSAEALIG